MDGRDYFFVSRQTMENFIQKKKFIEFGEYRGYLYGTSKDSIKRAMKSGKTCVLKVQPEVRQYFVIVIDKNHLVQVLCYLMHPFGDHKFYHVEVLCMIIGKRVLQVMLLLRTAEFKPFCVFVKPPPLKELRSSRLTVQQKGKPASVKSSMRTFKVA